MDLSQIPSAPPPPGVIPNFVNPPSIAPICRIVIAVTLPLMAIFLILRIYVRVAVSKKLGIDDFLCYISAAVVVAYCGVSLATLDNPVGVRNWNVPISRITVSFRQLAVSLIILYALGSLAVKATLLTLYLRVFSPDRRARTAMLCGLGFISVLYIVSVIANLALCLPRDGEDGWIQSGMRCEKKGGQFAEIQAIFGALTDLYVFFIPIKLLAGLNLNQRRKKALYVVFFTGFLACIVSIINAVFRFVVLGTGDIIWNGVPISALGAAELNLGIVCACVPVTFVLFQRAATTARNWASRLMPWAFEGQSALTESKIYPEVNGQQPPPVRQSIRSGLRSYIRRAYSGTPAPTSTAPALDSYVSADYDYHAQIARQSHNRGNSSEG
ncbi:hypothetical protein F4777DRAFT_548569 [Nemania sp. FL0916]|nr:hypothetical protein F4777DRAFT_548569 [Nemania sp. FL0916]